jgi:NTP pyrophosphatase (non-canonical NTP hydrolase)
VSDNKTTLQDLKNRVSSFADERDWKQFYNAKSMSMDIAVEAAELMDIFVWTQEKDIDERFQQKKCAVEHEVADILFALLTFAQQYNIDLSQALVNKMQHNAQKYPVDLCKGKNKKYNEY